MEDPNKQSAQRRFLVAAILSLLVFSGWAYLRPAEKPEDANSNLAEANLERDDNSSNTNQKGNGSDTNASAQPAITPNEEAVEAPNEVEQAPDETPNRSITIRSPLYEARIDSKGAVATSWILLLNDSSSEDDRKPLYAQGSTKETHIPLQLINAEGLKQGEEPFKLITGNQAIDGVINSRNYQVSGAEGEINLKGEESKKIDFVLKTADGTEVTKSFTFYANSYVNDLAVTIKKNGKVVPNAKIVIGPSIGDQAIVHHNFYKVEPEGVGYIDGGRDRHYAASMIESDKNEGKESVDGEVDWAGIGDTYFAMLAIPETRSKGVEYTSRTYEITTEPFFDGITSWLTRSRTDKLTKHLITAYVPIGTDGQTTRIYTGTKDYFVLTDYGKSLSDQTGREIDIEDAINYGYLRFVTKPLSVPILYCLQFLFNFTHNYGISIILFTLLFYSLLFPLRWYSSKSFKKAQKNAPRMKEVQDKVKALQKKGVPNDDPEMRKLQMEQLKMTKDSLPIGGCLPMVLQFPLLIALYVTVSVYLGFRQETFLWLPDLSSADPYHILEFAFAISMGLQMKFSPTSVAVTPEQKMQQRMMTYFMPVMMLWIMWAAPSGLLLYWFSGNVFMFGQQLFINWLNREPAEAVPETT